MRYAIFTVQNEKVKQIIEDVERKFNSPLYNDDGKFIPAVELGKMGGSKKSEKKLQACRINASAPCAPGKKRGRPFGSKNKKIVR